VVLSGRIIYSSPRKIHTPAYSGVSGKRAVRGHRSVYETLKGGISRSVLIAGSHRHIGVSALSLLSARLAESHRGLIMYWEGGYPPLNPFRNRRPAWPEGTFESLNDGVPFSEDVTRHPSDQCVELNRLASAVALARVFTEERTLNRTLSPDIMIIRLSSRERTDALIRRALPLSLSLS